MKLTIFFFFAAMMGANSTGLTQTINFSGKNKPLKEVFTAITEQTGYVVFGILHLREDSHPVTATVKNMPLEKFLELILQEQQINFRIGGKTIFLTYKEEKPTAKETAGPALLLTAVQPVSGTVVDSTNKPIQGASVRITPGNKGTTTKADGRFLFSNISPGTYTLEVSSIGFNTIKRKFIVTSNNPVDIGTVLLHVQSTAMEDVVVINTGYQKMKPNEMVGSVEYINKEMLSRSPANNILDRLRNLTPSLTFDRRSNGLTNVSNNKLGISIRGLSTINGPADPLIILDDFIYEGNLDHIDPNMIESVTILKDAVATSIWGMRAGNGVIVLTSKKAKKSARPSVSFSIGTSITPKPDLSKYPVVDSRTALELDIQRVKEGISTYLGDYYYGSEPLAILLNDRATNKISAADSARIVDRMAGVDFRKEYERAFYQTGLMQNYAFNISQATETGSFMASASYRKQVGNLKEKEDFLSATLSNEFRINSKLKLSQNITYSSSNSKTGAPGFRNVQLMGDMSSRQYSYASFYEPDGSPTGYGYNFQKGYLDTAGKGMFMDWNYYPAEDYKHNYTTNKSSALGISVNLDYRIFKELSLTLRYNYQNQTGQSKQIWGVNSHKARDLINSMTQINYVTNTVNRPLPIGDIITNENSRTQAHTLDMLLNYKVRFNRHSISSMFGFVPRKSMQNSSQNVEIGYQEDPLLVNPVIPYGNYMHAIYGYETDILGEYLRPASPRITEFRSIANFFNFSYALDEKYRLYVSYRNEGANMFGLAINDRWKPLWSAGFDADLKDLLKENTIVNSLNISATAGISGNIDMSKTSEPIASIFPPGQYLVPAARIATVNNPLLRWEKVRQFDFGLATGLFNGLISASFHYYIKYSSDLYGPELFDYTNFDTQTIERNGSKMRTNGFDLSATIHAVRTDNLSVSLTLNTALNKSKITNYYSGRYMVHAGDETLLKSQGSSPNGIIIYKFKGLNNEGLPLYMVDGKTTTNSLEPQIDFSKKGVNSDAISIIPSTTPTIRFNNSLFVRFKAFSFLVGFSYEGKFYSKFSNYASMSDFEAMGIIHNSYYNRWQKPGDELHTNIPRFNISASEAQNRTNLMLLNSSEYVWKRGDNINVNTIMCTWRFRLVNQTYCTIGAKVNDIGIIWSKEKDLRHKDFPHQTIRPKTYTLDFNINF